VGGLTFLHGLFLLAEVEMGKREKELRLPNDLEQFRYLTEQEVSELTGRGLQTLRNDRYLGRGFPYHKLGRSIRYRLADILASMESCRVETEGL
jgi:hypothetical protein